MNVPKGYHLHHINDTLRYSDVERYIQWNPEDLVILSASEHARLHMTGKKLSDNVKEKMQLSHSNPVMCLETGIIYISANAAEKETRIRHISNVCSGSRKTAGGFHWVRLEQLNEQK